MTFEEEGDGVAPKGRCWLSLRNLCRRNARVEPSDDNSTGKLINEKQTEERNGGATWQGRKSREGRGYNDTDESTDRIICKDGGILCFGSECCPSTKKKGDNGSDSNSRTDNTIRDFFTSKSFLSRGTNRYEGTEESSFTKFVSPFLSDSKTQDTSKTKTGKALCAGTVIGGALFGASIKGKDWCNGLCFPNATKGGKQNGTTGTEGFNNTKGEAADRSLGSATYPSYGKTFDTEEAETLQTELSDMTDDDTLVNSPGSKKNKPVSVQELIEAQEKFWGVQPYDGDTNEERISALETYIYGGPRTGSLPHRLRNIILVTEKKSKSMGIRGRIGGLCTPQTG